MTENIVMDRKAIFKGTALLSGLVLISLLFIYQGKISESKIWHKLVLYAAEQDIAYFQYLQGQYSEPEVIESLIWYIKASEKDYAPALEKVRDLHSANFKNTYRGYESIIWSKASAILGNRDAQYLVGFSYYFGEEYLEQDFIEAVKWLRMAAAQSHIESQTLLNIYYKAKVEEVDFESLKSNLLAAGQGDAGACLSLAFLFDYDIKPRNIEEAQKWYRLSAESGGKQEKHRYVEWLSYNPEASDAELEANKLLTEMSKTGDAQALSRLWYVSRYGSDTSEAETEKALMYAIELAKILEPKDIYSLGMQYLEGIPLKPDYEEAMIMFEHASNKGHIQSMHQLGLGYHYGNGVEINLGKAAELFLKAAEGGLAEAQYALAKAYSTGRGMPLDFKMAMEWLKRAADQDYAPAKYSIGHAYANGEGVEKDNLEAINWYRVSADQGSTDAMYALAWSYLNGNGVEKDEPQSARWFKSAAELGHSDAEYAIGYAYYTGTGIEQDYFKSYVWFMLAAKSGHEEAVRMRDQMSGKLSSNELERAKELFLACRMDVPGCKRISE